MHRPLQTKGSLQLRGSVLPLSRGRILAPAPRVRKDSPPPGDGAAARTSGRLLLGYGSKRPCLRHSPNRLPATGHLKAGAGWAVAPPNRVPPPPLLPEGGHCPCGGSARRKPPTVWDPYRPPQGPPQGLPTPSRGPPRAQGGGEPR